MSLSKKKWKELLFLSIYCHARSFAIWKSYPITWMINQRSYCKSGFVPQEQKYSSLRGSSTRPCWVWTRDNISSASVPCMYELPGKQLRYVDVVLNLKRELNKNASVAVLLTNEFAFNHCRHYLRRTVTCVVEAQVSYSISSGGDAVSSSWRVVTRQWRTSRTRHEGLEAEMEEQKVQWDWDIWVL